MTRQSRELISVSRTLKSFRFVEHSVTKNQELQENVISVKWHQAALGFGLLLLLSIWKHRGRSAWEHWRIFINWDGVISVPTVAWPLFPRCPAGICVRLCLARKPISISPSLFALFCGRPGLLCQFQTESFHKASGKSLKPNLITSWPTALTSDVTESWKRFSVLGFNLSSETLTLWKKDDEI